MRRSIYLVPTEHADRVFAATRPSETAYRSLLGRLGIGDKAYDNLKAKIVQIASTPKHLDQIREELTRAPRHLTEVLQFMCAQGDLLRIKSSSLRSNDLTYAATSSWLDRRFDPLDQAESLTWLAGEYLSAFGPATVGDFAWWTGQSESAARAAFGAHDTTDVGGGLLLHAHDERAFAGMRVTANRVNLLPKWDCYTMGYAEPSRARFVDPKLLGTVYDTGGNAQPVVLVEGEVQGTWSMRLTGERARIVLGMFSTPGPKLRARLEEEANLIASFMEAERVTLDIAKASPAPRPKASPRKAPAVKKKPATKAGAARAKKKS